MPGGIPVATVALNGAKNTGILAASILACNDTSILEKVIQYKTMLKDEVLLKVNKMKNLQKD